MSADDVNLDELMPNRGPAQPIPDNTTGLDPQAVHELSASESVDSMFQQVLDTGGVILASDMTPEDQVPLELDLLRWQKEPTPSAPRFAPLKLSLLLNLDSIPILADDRVQADVEFQLHQYTERLNGYRILQQGISQTIMHRASLAIRVAKDKRAYAGKTAQLKLQIAAEKDSKGKALYTNETSREAELMVRVNNDGELRSLDERIFTDGLALKGFDSRLEALREESKILERELESMRDALNFMVNTGLVAASHMNSAQDGITDEDGNSNLEQNS